MAISSQCVRLFYSAAEGDLLTSCRILSSLDAKSRGLLEKDPSNPNATQKAPASSGKAATGPGAGRSALKEAIAARKKALPSRPESAQPAFDAEDQAPKSSARTVPTGAPLSSLSSAPMRPAMKPRRAEVNRPATADPYASRPSSRAAQTSSKPAGSPRTVRSKASTPSSKPINAPRLRPHESGQTGTARGKPKKLDLSKSKSHGDLQAASRSRSDSDDSVANQASTRAHHADVPRASEDREDSPAPIVLESPPLSAAHPPSQHQHTEDGNKVTREPVGEPQHLSLEEPVATVSSPHVPEPSAATPARHSKVSPESEVVTTAQPEEMIIYEDPATPVVSEAAVERPTPMRSPRRAEGLDVNKEASTDASPALQTPDRNPALELPPSQSNVTSGVDEVPFPSASRRTPLRGSPSPSRKPPATPSENVSAVESTTPYEPSGAQDRKSVV